MQSKTSVRRHSPWAHLGSGNVRECLLTGHICGSRKGQLCEGMAMAKNCERSSVFFFAKVAKPFHQVAQDGVHGQSKTQTRVCYPPLQWGSPQQQAFDKLKKMCSSTPVLGFQIIASHLFCILTTVMMVGACSIPGARLKEEGHRLCQQESIQGRKELCGA